MSVSPNKGLKVRGSRAGISAVHHEDSVLCFYPATPDLGFWLWNKPQGRKKAATALSGLSSQHPEARREAVVFKNKKTFPNLA